MACAQPKTLCLFLPTVSANGRSSRTAHGRHGMAAQNLWMVLFKNKCSLFVGFCLASAKINWFIILFGHSDLCSHSFFTQKVKHDAAVMNLSLAPPPELLLYQTSETLKRNTGRASCTLPVIKYPGPLNLALLISPAIINSTWHWPVVKFGLSALRREEDWCSGLTP